MDLPHPSNSISNLYGVLAFCGGALAIQYYAWCIAYFTFWRHLPQSNPDRKRSTTSSRWYSCRVDGDDFTYIRFNVDTVSLKFWSIFFPLPTWMLGVATVPLAQVEILSPTKLLLKLEAKTFVVTASGLYSTFPQVKNEPSDISASETDTKSL